MEVIEEQAIQQATTPPRVWKRFVDDSFAIMKKSTINSFHDTLNSIDSHINFTIEQEKDGQLAFLDTLVSHNNGSISTTVYRKPTHTDRYLDFSSHHDEKHKISAAKTLINRSLHLPSNTSCKIQELNHVCEALTLNGYPKNLVTRITQQQRNAPTSSIS